MATRTYALIEDEIDPTEILGYYTLLPSTIVFPQGHSLQKRFPSDPPVNRLARLAVDNSVKGYGLGAYLLIECLRWVVDGVEGDSLALWLPFEQCLEAVELSGTSGR